jgi:PAS domain S-box-containing protein
MERWPLTLKGYVGMILMLPTPAIIFWGPDQTQIYNDGYSTIMGPRHPRYLGAPYRECWPDTYPTISPWMQRVLQGEVVTVERTLIPVTRYGFTEEAFFTFTFSPLRDDEGRIAGILQIVTEMTEAVVSERRSSTLRGLIPNPEVQTVEDGPSPILEVLSANPQDISFALHFLAERPGYGPSLMGAAGLEPSVLEPAFLQKVCSIADEVFTRNAPMEIRDWQSRFPGFQARHWPDPIQTAVALPIRRGAEDARGVIILGASPRLRFDEAYREFFHRISHEIASHLAVTHERLLTEQLKLTMDSAKMGSWHIDLKTNRITLSSRTASFLGISGPQEADIFQLNADRIHPEDLDRINAAWRTAIEQRELYSAEYRIRRRDGELRWLHSWGKASDAAAGKEPKSFSGVTLDVTDEKRAEASLKESEARFRLMADTLPQIVWMLAPDSDELTYVSHQWLEYSGLSQQASLGRAWRESVHPEDRAQLEEKWRYSLSRGLPIESECRVQRRDGAYRYHLLKGIPIRSIDGNILHWLGTLTDIHERRMAQLEYEKNVDSSPAILWITQPDGVCTYLSKQWYAVTGQTGEEGLGFGWLKAVHPEDAPTVRNHFEKANAARAPFWAEFRLRTANGDYRWAIDAGNPRFDERGNYLGYAGTVFDIHARKLAEAEAQLLVKDLAEAVRTRDEFMSIASHELKTPISSLKLQTQGMNRAIAKNDATAFSPDRVLKLVKQTERQIGRLSRLVDDMLDVARINTGKLTVVKLPSDLCRLLRETTERFRPQFEAANISFEVSCHAPAAWGEVDRDRIEQVLVNLLTNALRYGNSQPVHVQMTEDGQMARISVEDRGRGIAEEHHVRVFERFERAISANEVSGLGLGLFISRQIVEAHGGRIWVESNPGDGSTFTFELPLMSHPP